MRRQAPYVRIVDAGSVVVTAIPLFRLSDPETSRQAARRVAPAAASLERQILDALAFRALTADSVCKVLGIDVRRWPSVKTCMSRLKNEGKLVWTGEPINGMNVWTRPENAVPLRVKVAGEVL